MNQKGLNLRRMCPKKIQSNQENLKYFNKKKCIFKKYI